MKKIFIISGILIMTSAFSQFAHSMDLGMKVIKLGMEYKEAKKIAKGLIKRNDNLSFILITKKDGTFAREEVGTPGKSKFSTVVELQFNKSGNLYQFTMKMKIANITENDKDFTVNNFKNMLELFIDDNNQTLKECEHESEVHVPRKDENILATCIWASRDGRYLVSMESVFITSRDNNNNEVKHALINAVYIDRKFKYEGSK